MTVGYGKDLTWNDIGMPIFVVASLALLPGS